MAGDPADRRQRLQMLGARIGRQKQEEDQVDRAAVDRFVVEGFGKPSEQAVDSLQTFHFAVRNGDSMAESGRAELLPLRNTRQDHRRIDVEPLSRETGELRQQRLLASARKRGLDRVEIEEI